MVAAYISATARNWDNNRSSARAHRKTERSKSHRCPCRKFTLGRIGGVVRPRLARAGDGFAATGPPKFNLARATKRTYIRIIVPRPQPPSYAARKKPRCLFCRGFAFIYRRLLNAVALWMLQIWLKRRNKFWPSLNGLLNNKFSTWAAASSTICSRGRPKFRRRCARTVRKKAQARKPPASPDSPWVRGGRQRAIAAPWHAGPHTGA
jgi:hypothetical protein